MFSLRRSPADAAPDLLRPARRRQRPAKMAPVLKPVHDASDEFKVKLGDRIMRAPAQTVMFVPRGTAHTFQNVGTSPGVILVGVTPGGF